MTAYITLRIDNPDEAADLLRDMATYPDSPILTPGLENVVAAVVATCGVRPYVEGLTEASAERELFYAKAEMIGVDRGHAEEFLARASWLGFDDAFAKLVEEQP
jgi:hypothetical protein